MRDLSKPATTTSSISTGSLKLNKRLLIFIALVVLAITSVGFQLMFGKNSLKQQHKVSHDIELYQAKIDSLKHALDSCDIEIERLKNDSLYKEGLLRTRYGMSRKGERVFQMVK